ncbi:beta-phosphoglucomutase [Fusibacter sp. JL216-2]|uniref:beta-phosphoglucomutase n=1 Tax=Fusibacter sp. JL216-2 TaxID=3071453 RepID=UPI003D346FCA
MAKEYKGYIFDLDGVLVDTAKYHFKAWKRLADEMNIRFNEDDNERLKGVSRMASLDIILELGNKTLSEEEKVSLATRKNEWYVEFISKMDASEILPGALEFLKMLKENGYKCALGSASKNAGLILERTGLKDYFDTVVDGTHVSKAKPDPEVFTLGADNMGLSYTDCVVFEDSVAGLQAAKAAGMVAVGIGEASVLTDADMVVKDLSEFNLNML